MGFFLADSNLYVVWQGLIVSLIIQIYHAKNCRTWRYSLNINIINTLGVTDIGLEINAMETKIMTLTDNITTDITVKNVLI